MKKLNLTTFFFILFSTLTFGQQLTQTVRGTIQDADNQLPLIGASIVLKNTNPIIGMVTDIDGHFRLEKVLTRQSRKYSG